MITSWRQDWLAGKTCEIKDVLDGFDFFIVAGGIKNPDGTYSTVNNQCGNEDEIKMLLKLIKERQE